MLSKNDDLKKITEVLSSYEYLMRLSEDTILDTCYPAVLSDNTITFTDFTQDHRDAYTRLKFATKFSIYDQKFKQSDASFLSL